MKHLDLYHVFWNGSSGVFSLRPEFSEIKPDKMRIALVALLSLSFSLSYAQSKKSINWMSWEEAVIANKKKPKKIFVDVYTDWCGWCKKMDKSTFQDEKVIKYLNKHFYAVKLDAEQKEDITFNGSTFKHVNQGRNGTHQLAFALLDGKMGYPAFVSLDEQFHRIMVSPGYKQPTQMMRELGYVKTKSYEKMNMDDYKP